MKSELPGVSLHSRVQPMRNHPMRHPLQIDHENENSESEDESKLEGKRYSAKAKALKC